MLCGDFNIDLLNKDCNNSTLFLNTMYSLSLLQIISKPTRITDNSATLIDNFFINEPCNFESGILISDISDHFQIFFNRKNFFWTNSSKNANKSVHYRLVNQNTLSALDEMLALRPYLLKIQLNHGFQVRFVQLSRSGKTIIHLLDKIKCPISSTHDLEIFSQIKLGKPKLIILPTNFNNLREIVKALGSK